MISKEGKKKQKETSVLLKIALKSTLATPNTAFSESDKLTFAAPKYS